MSVPREDSDGAVPRAAAPEPPGGASSEDTESREDLTIEAKEISEAIRFGHADAKERFREFDEHCERVGWGRGLADRLFWLLYRGELAQESSSRLKIARLKNRMVPAIGARLDAVRAIAAGMPTVAERLAALEDALVAWKKRADDGATDLETAESDAEELKRRAGVLEEVARQTAMLSVAAEKARKLAETAHMADDAPDFAKEEMETVRRVLEILARQTDWTKAEKSSHVLQRAEERKRRLEELAVEYSRLAERLEKAGQLEDRVAAEREQLLWQDPELAPAPVPPAAFVRSSRQFEAVLANLSEREKRAEEVLSRIGKEHNVQFETFRKEATKAFNTARMAKRLSLLDDESSFGCHPGVEIKTVFDDQRAFWTVQGKGLGWRIGSLDLDPQPAVLFGRTADGSFEERCRTVLGWYGLLFDVRGWRQEKAVRELSEEPRSEYETFPAPAFLRLRELAGSRPVDDPEVRELVKTSREWNRLCEKIETRKPRKGDQTDDGHRRAFGKAAAAVRRLKKLCETCPVGSPAVQTELRKLDEAVKWISDNRLPLENALDAEKDVYRDLEALETFGHPVEHWADYLDEGRELLQRSDFPRAADAFAKARTRLTRIFKTMAPRIVGQSAAWIAVAVPGTDDLMEFNRGENGLWYGRNPVTPGQFLAVLPKGVDVWNSEGICTGMTLHEAEEFAKKLTRLARRTGLRLPDDSPIQFRIPHYREWEAGAASGAFRSVAKFGEWCITEDKDHDWYWRASGSGSQNSLDSRFEHVGFRLICDRYSMTAPQNRALASRALRRKLTSIVMQKILNQMPIGPFQDRARMVRSRRKKGGPSDSGTS